MALELVLVQRIVVIHSEYIYILEAQLLFLYSGDKVVVNLEAG